MHRSLMKFCGARLAKCDLKNDAIPRGLFLKNCDDVAGIGLIQFHLRSCRKPCVICLQFRHFRRYDMARSRPFV